MATNEQAVSLLLTDMPESERIGARKALEASRPPRLPRQTLPFTPGLHLLLGAKGSGKTVNSLALQGRLLTDGYYCVYLCVMEPRGIPVSSASTPSRTWNVQSYEKLLVDAMKQAAEATTTSVPVVIVDSLTYTLRQLAETKAVLKDEKGATYTGGLTYGDVVGALHHQLLAEHHGVALIGCLNTDLLPVAPMLAGAVEGVMYSNGAGNLSLESRSTGRTRVTLSLTSTVAWALYVLGYSREGVTRSTLQRTNTTAGWSAPVP